MILRVAAFYTSFLILFTSHVSCLYVTDILSSYPLLNTLEVDLSARTITDEPTCVEETRDLSDDLLDYQPESPPLKDYCEIKGEVAKCDIKLVNFDPYETKCKEIGGQLIKIKYDVCFPLQYPDFQEYNITKIVVDDYPVCAAKSCNETDIIDLFELSKKVYGIHCPEQKFKTEFVLSRIKATKELNIKTCGWLQSQPLNRKLRTCFNKKFQLYSGGYLPASIACAQTCKPYPFLNCIEERETTRFTLKKIIDPKTGNVTETNKRCIWLRRQTSAKTRGVCTRSATFYNDTTYGKAHEVCTDSCNSCNKFPYYSYYPYYDT